MGLIHKTTSAASGTSTLTPRPSRAQSTFIKSTMTGLLHKLVCKVLKVLKNQKTLVFNQRQLAACYNVNHSNHPIELGSISGSNSDDELEGEDAFDVPAPQFWEDPHSEDEETTIAGGGDSASASTTRDDESDDYDDDKDEEDSESEEEDGDIGVVEARDGSESDSRDE